MYETLFALAGLATPLWLLLLFLPSWRPVRRLAESAVVPLYLCVLYAIGIGSVLLHYGPSIMADFGDAAGVTRLLTQPAIALVAWIHILAFDQLIGLYIYRDNMANRYLPLPVQSVLLLITFMLGPVGFLGYCALRALRRIKLPRLFAGETAHLLTGVIGLGYMVLCTVALYLRGNPYIGIEGNLYKPIRFNLAVAIFNFTVAALLPLMGFSETARRRWRWANVTVSLYTYFAETYLTFQGLDPRFSRHFANWGQMSVSIGLAVLGALGWTVLFVILMWQLCRRLKTDRPLMRLALRYGMSAVLLAAGAGIWMVMARGHLSGGAGDILVVHAIGFHGLQALPLVAWLFERAHVDAHAVRHWVHAAGMAWLTATLLIAGHAALGLPLATFSPALAGCAVALIGWGFVTLTGLTAQPAPRETAASVHSPY